MITGVAALVAVVVAATVAAVFALVAARNITMPWAVVSAVTAGLLVASLGLLLLRAALQIRSHRAGFRWVEDVAEHQFDSHTHLDIPADELALIDTTWHHLRYGYGVTGLTLIVKPYTDAETGRVYHAAVTDNGGTITCRDLTPKQLRDARHNATHHSAESFTLRGSNGHTLAEAIVTDHTAGRVINRGSYSIGVFLRLLAVQIDMLRSRANGADLVRMDDISPFLDKCLNLGSETLLRRIGDEWARLRRHPRWDPLAVVHVRLGGVTPQAATTTRLGLRRDTDLMDHNDVAALVAAVGYEIFTGDNMLFTTDDAGHFLALLVEPDDATAGTLIAHFRDQLHSRLTDGVGTRVTDATMEVSLTGDSPAAATTFQITDLPVTFGVARGAATSTTTVTELVDEARARSLADTGDYDTDRARYTAAHWGIEDLAGLTVDVDLTPMWTRAQSKEVYHLDAKFLLPDGSLNIGEHVLTAAAADTGLYERLLDYTVTTMFDAAVSHDSVTRNSLYLVAVDYAMFTSFNALTHIIEQVNAHRGQLTSEQVGVITEGQLDDTTATWDSMRALAASGINVIVGDVDDATPVSVYTDTAVKGVCLSAGLSASSVTSDGLAQVQRITQRAHDAGLPVYAIHVYSPDVMERLLECGVDQVSQPHEKQQF